jgi:two-component system, LytTR family, response regulator
MGTRYKCLVVDDEKPAHLVLKSHISKCEELEHSGSAFNGKEAIKLLLENEYDFVFLDIDMPLINGIEVMQTLAKRPATIVTTAFNNFAFDAYQHDAIDYLLKPVSFPRFLKAIEKGKHFWGLNQDKKPQKTTITLRIEGISQEIPLENILYFSSVGNYVKVYFREKIKPIVVYDSLKNILENTSSDTFVQTHKSFIVNTNYIETIAKDGILLKGDICVPLGRKYELLVSKIVMF